MWGGHIRGGPLFISLSSIMYFTWIITLIPSSVYKIHRYRIYAFGNFVASFTVKRCCNTFLISLLTLSSSVPWTPIHLSYFKMPQWRAQGLPIPELAPVTMAYIPVRSRPCITCMAELPPSNFCLIIFLSSRSSFFSSLAKARRGSV